MHSLCCYYGFNNQAFLSESIDIKIEKHLCVIQKLIPRLSVVTGEPVMGLVENIIANISHILIVTNSAVNIVVYAMKVSSGWWRDNRQYSPLIGPRRTSSSGTCSAPGCAGRPPPRATTTTTPPRSRRRRPGAATRAPARTSPSPPTWSTSTSPWTTPWTGPSSPSRPPWTRRPRSSQPTSKHRFLVTTHFSLVCRSVQLYILFADGLYEVHRSLIRGNEFYLGFIYRTHLAEYFLHSPDCEKSENRYINIYRIRKCLDKEYKCK